MTETVIPCPDSECYFPTTHHHLIECDEQPIECDGKEDDYGVVHICCQLGPLYAPSKSLMVRTYSELDSRKDSST